MSVTGDFADQQDVPLPASYVTFQTVDPTIAAVAATGQLTGIAEGYTALVVSSHGIFAATVVEVDDPNDPSPPEYSGLTVSPQAMTLADNGGMQQLDCFELNDDGSVDDLTASSTGTLYYVSNPNVVTVSADGLISAVGDGSASVTVITDGQEALSTGPGRACANQPADSRVPAAASCRAPTAPGRNCSGALSTSTTVQIAPVSLAGLPEGSPIGFQIFAAEQLDLGGQILAVPAEFTIPVPAGTPVGTEVYAYLATTLPDDTGAEVPVWQEVDVAYVGANGFAQTGTPPYQGILSRGTYAFAMAIDPSMAKYAGSTSFR